MIIRTYFDKNNTIVSKSRVNTGLNPITEIFYGGGDNNKTYSRFLFHFNEDRIRGLYQDGTFADLDKIKHTLRMTNTGSFDKNLLNTTVDGKLRTSSFDLIVYKLGQEWDNGTGYDYQIPLVTNGEQAYYEGASNWFSASTLEDWVAEGTFNISPSPVERIGTGIHFDLGNENIEYDITDYVNNLLTGGTTNFGLGLAFEREFETNMVETGDFSQYVGFFTNNTNTFYEPHIETVYSNHIKDDRNDFYLDKENKLYLYVNLGGAPTNLDELPTVTILDNNGSEIDTPIATQVTKGVYSVDVLVDSTQDNIETMYSDEWNNIKVNGITRNKISNEFVVKDSMGYFEMGGDMVPKKIGVNISGLQNNEKIIRGDIRKVMVSARVPYTVEQNQKVSELKYRIYVKEGSGELTVVDFHPLEMAVNNYYFLLDTASLLPNKYFVDVLVTSNLEVTTIKDVVGFTITSQVNYRK